MNNKVLLFVILLSCTSLYSQTNFDSLMNAWHDESLEDTSRMQALCTFFDFYGLYEYDLTPSTFKDTSLFFAHELYDFADNAGSVKFKGRALQLEAFVYIQADFEKSRLISLKALEFAQESGDKHGITSCFYRIGVSFYYQDRLPEAYRYMSDALTLSQQIGYFKYEALSYSVIGNLYAVLGDLEKAVDYYLDALDLAETHDLADKHVSLFVSNLGIFYSQMGDTLKGIEFIERGLESDMEPEIRVGRHLQLADFYHGIDRLKSEEHFAKATRLVQDSHMPRQQMQIAHTKGILALKNGNNRDAVRHCSSMLALAEEAKTLNWQRLACQCLYEAYKALGQGNNALLFHEKLLTLKDSLQWQETNKKLQLMEFTKQILADSLQQEEEMLRVQMAHDAEVARKNKARNAALGGIGLVLLLAGGLWSRLRYIRKSKATLQIEKDRSEGLLLNILPAEVAEELKLNGKAIARDFEMVSIIFTDFKEFTEISEKLSATELVSELNYCFEGFDAIMEKHGIEKIKTIGDAYMAASGLPVSTPDATRNAVLAALEMQELVRKRKKERELSGDFAFEMRAGIHTGPVVAGIVGVKKFQYDIWGDTVNTASRMESNSRVGEVNISNDTYQLLKDDPTFIFNKREKIQVKGKGEMSMYFCSHAS